MSDDFRGRILYHYTSADALLNILDTTTLWASNALFLNDASELTFARDVLLSLGDERASNGGDPEVWRSAKARVLSFLPDSGDIKLPGDYSIYVTSFSTEPDSLTMWQWYGRDGGFAIGFSVDDIEAGLEFKEPPSDTTQMLGLTTEETQKLWASNFQLHGSFRKIGYGEAQTRKGLAATVESIFAAPECLNIGSILEDLACFKHEAFSGESEVRLVLRVPSCMGPVPKVRTARGHLVPYECVRFPYRAVRRIRIGPGTYTGRSQRALEHRFATPRGEWSQVRVSPSGIPFIA